MNPDEQSHTLNWSAFAQAAPEIAALGKQKLFSETNGEVAILATVDQHGRPWLAPVCPIFAADGLYLLISQGSPKVHHLRHSSHFALHALVDADDAEFQIAGIVTEVMGDARAQVISAIPFPSFDPDDPIFECRINRALKVTWPDPGKPARAAWRT